jgi:hypothetical protein
MITGIAISNFNVSSPGGCKLEIVITISLVSSSQVRLLTLIDPIFFSYSTDESGGTVPK